MISDQKSKYFTREMAAEIAFRATNEPYEKRRRYGKMTGEWIVYLPRMQKNYYLCISGHEIPDQLIYNRIVKNVIADFPEIEKWISDSAAIS